MKLLYIKTILNDGDWYIERLDNEKLEFVKIAARGGLDSLLERPMFKYARNKSLYSVLLKGFNPNPESFARKSLYPADLENDPDLKGYTIESLEDEMKGQIALEAENFARETKAEAMAKNDEYAE